MGCACDRFVYSGILVHFWFFRYEKWVRLVAGWGMVNAKSGLDCSVILVEEAANGPPCSEQIITRKWNTVSTFVWGVYFEIIFTYTVEHTPLLYGKSTSNKPALKVSLFSKGKYFAIFGGGEGGWISRRQMWATVRGKILSVLPMISDCIDFFFF